MTAAISETMQSLRLKFAGQLAGRIDAIQEQHERLIARGWTRTDGEALLHLVHGLTGAAGTFGMPSLSDVARDLEQLLAQHLRKSQDDDATAELKEAVERLRNVAQVYLMQNAPNLKPLPTTPRLDHSPLVYLVEDDPEQATYLTDILRNAGYRVQSWHCAEDFRAAMTAPDTERPDAIVMDMVFPEGDETGIELVSECDLGRDDGVAVVMVSVRDDLQARLRALRAGVTRYLAKPVQGVALVELLDALTGRQPSEPYRVLLIDDDPLLLDTYAAILREAGMEVQSLSDPLLTLESVKSFRPDVLMLDVYMPEASGPELAAVLRESDEHLHLPILFISAETDMSQQLLALNLGGDDFLVKPIRPEYLVSSVMARARRARQSTAMRLRLQTTLYEREREHLALNRHAIVSIADRRGRIVYVNDRFCDISGYRRDELLGQNHRVVKSGEHPPDFYREMWKTISSGKVWQGEICNRRKDGSLYWVDSTITPFVDDDGLPYQYVSIRTDISAVKAAAAEQQAVSALSLLLAESAAELLAAGPETLDVAINQALRRAGEHLGADRAYLFQLRDDEHLDNSHEWCAPGISPQQKDLQSLPVQNIEWLWAQMQRNEWISIPDVATLPPDAAETRSTLEQLGVRALSAYPVQRAGKSVGFVGFDQVTPHCSWDEQALNLVALLGGMIESALVRTAGERALSESSNRLAATLESTKDGILAVDSEGQLLFMNQQFRRMWNISEAMLDSASDEELLAHILAQLVDPKGFVAQVGALIHSNIESDDLIELNDGRIFLRHYQPLEGYESTSGRVWSFHDITARRRAELSLMERERQLLEAQSLASLGNWHADMLTGELSWSDEVYRIFGHEPGSMTPTVDLFHAAVHPDDRHLVRNSEREAEKTGHHSVVHRIIRPDDSIRHVHELAQAEVDADGNLVRLTGTVQDVTERIKSDQRVRESEQRFAFAVEGAGDGVWDWHLKTGHMAFSAHYEPMLGYQPGELLERIETWKDSVHPEDLEWVQQQLTDYLTGNSDQYSVELRLRCKDGNYKWVLCRGTVVERDAQGDPVRMIGIHSDISRRKQDEQELIAAREEADRANQAKSEFLSSMSHELRTPMNAILGFGQLMEFDDSLPEEHRDSAKEILQAGRHLLELINEILDLAKIESGKVDLSLEPIELGTVVEECLSLVGPLAAKRDIQISHSGLEGAVVRADRTRLKQALVNLLSNAVKYNHDAGSVSIEIQPQGERRLRILVSDTGRGIPVDKLPGLFEPFNRLDAENSETEGTGIGLTITRRIIEMMGGSVGVESEMGVGSTFWLELPREISVAESKSTPASTSVPATFEAADIRPSNVLYIEDNPANLNLVAQTLDRLPDISLLTAESPALGIETALARRPDLILLDINMPGMNGYEVLDAIRAEPDLQATPVVAITANAMPRDVERGMAAGFVDYLTKPLNLDQLLSTVQRCLSGSTR